MEFLAVLRALGLEQVGNRRKRGSLRGGGSDGGRKNQAPDAEYHRDSAPLPHRIIMFPPKISAVSKTILARVSMFPYHTIYAVPVKSFSGLVKSSKATDIRCH